MSSPTMVASSVDDGTWIAGVHRVASPITGRFATEWMLDLKPQTIERRVERLERRVTRLEELPGRVDALTGQFLQLRAEMGSEFSAVRLGMRESAAAVTKELVHEIGRMHEHTMREVMDRIDVAAAQLSGQMQGFQDEVQGFQEQVRGFQEQVVASLKAIHERLPSR